MCCLTYEISNEKVDFLMSSDEVLGRLIRFIGTSEIAIEKDGFQCVLKYIIGQQISDKARETIWSHFCTFLGDVNPLSVLSVCDHDFRSIGLPGHKAECIKALAAAAVEGRVDFSAFPTFSNDEIIAKLTMIKGIGRWTAEMYLIFSLGRENVLSRGDGTIRRTIQWMYQLGELPNPTTVAKYFAGLEHYATIVSAYLWKAVSLGLTKRPFNESIPQ